MCASSRPRSMRAAPALLQALLVHCGMLCGSSRQQGRGRLSPWCAPRRGGHPPCIAWRVLEHHALASFLTASSGAGTFGGLVRFARCQRLVVRSSLSGFSPLNPGIIP